MAELCGSRRPQCPPHLTYRSASRNKMSPLADIWFCLCHVDAAPILNPKYSSPMSVSRNYVPTGQSIRDTTQRCKGRPGMVLSLTEKKRLTRDTLRAFIRALPAPRYDVRIINRHQCAADLDGPAIAEAQDCWLPSSEKRRRGRYLYPTRHAQLRPSRLR